MNWKNFLVLPIAALLLGIPLHAPALKEAIPAVQDEACDYPRAVKYYLDAYAYSLENPQLSQRLIDAAETERRLCRSDTSVLAARIECLKRSLFP